MAAVRDLLLQYRRRAYEILELGGPAHPMGRVTDIAMSVLIVLNCIAAAIETVPAIEAAYRVEFNVFEAFSIAVYTIEYVMRLWCAVEYPAHPPAPANYIRRLRFAARPIMIVDLIAFLPFYLTPFVPDLRAVRVLRLIRLFKLARYSPGVVSLLHVIEQERRALAGVLLIMFSMALLAATGIYFCERNVQPEAFGNVPSALWWALATLTTVGYGDIVPHTVAGRIFGGVVMITGLAVFALPIAIIASGFASEIHRRDFVLRWGLVASVPLFQGLPADMIARISRLLRTRSVTAGTVLLEKGETEERTFFIVSGEVDLDDRGTVVRLSEGGYFGARALVRRVHAQVTARAVSTCSLLVLEASDYRFLLSEDPAIRTRVHSLTHANAGADYGRSQDIDWLQGANRQ